MNKKSILLIVFGIILLYPIYSVFQLGQSGNELNEVQNAVSNYQISIWISWAILVCIAIYYKWTYKSNFFFTALYAFLLIGFVVFGFYTQKMFNSFNLASGFEDNYSLGVFIALENIVAAAVITGILQACVWWFTRRWHRRMR